MQRPKDLVRDALAGLETARVPFVPLVDAFAALHLQVPVREFHGNAATLARGLDLARRLSRADAIVCLPDDTLLAEACGCPVSWEAGGPRLRAPASPITLAAAPEAVLARGRIPVVLDALERLRHGVGQQWGLFGALTGPYALARQLWPGDLEGALDGGEEPARELIEATTTLCVQLAHRLGELELDGCLVMDGAHMPGPGGAAAAVAAYETLANVLAFYGCTPLYHGDRFDWLSAQGSSSFELFFPSAESAANTCPATGNQRPCAAVSEAVLRQNPQSVGAAVAELLRHRPRMLTTSRGLPCDTALPSLQAVAAALGA